MYARILALAGAAAVLALPALPARADQSVKRTVDRSVPAAGATALDLAGHNGDVTLVADAGSTVRVRAVMSGRSIDAVDRIVVDVLRSGNAVRVQDRCPGSRQILWWKIADCGVDYEIHYPRGLAVDVRTQNGDVQITGAAAPVTVALSNGDVSVRGAAANVNVSAEHGDVSIALAGNWHGSAVGMKTSAGDVSLRVPPGFRGTLNAHTRMGSVEDRAGLNGGPATVNATTTFGDVEVTRE